jgi:hypothetical protein
MISVTDVHRAFPEHFHGRFLLVATHCACTLHVTPNAYGDLIMTGSPCPATTFTTIRDVDFLKAVRLRLGLLPIVNFPVARCPAARRGPCLLMHLRTRCPAQFLCTAMGPPLLATGWLGVPSRTTSARRALQLPSTSSPSISSPWPAGAPGRTCSTPLLSASSPTTIISPVATSRRGQQVSKTIERVDRKNEIEAPYAWPELHGDG